MGKADRLIEHPNFHFPDPNDFSDAISYTIETIALLISPPKLDGEADEFECDYIAYQVREIEGQIKHRWRRYKNGQQGQNVVC